MSFNPQGNYRKEVRTGIPNDVVLKPGLMAERTHLPELDYRALQLNSLKRLSKTAKVPADRAAGQRYEALVKYLGLRSDGASQVDAAEVDRRMRTWFEDVINRVLQDPREWDAEKVLDGRALMDYLCGVKGAGAQPPPQAASEA